MELVRYTLMNKNTPVLSFEYDMQSHQAVRITDSRNVEAAPFGMVDRHGRVSKKELNYWWHHRAIPASRTQIKLLLENLKLESTLELAEKSFGLSLSDCYWLNDERDPKNWDVVNFFDNDFSDDLGFLTLGQDSAGSSLNAFDYGSVNFSSPNGTLGGDLLKKWKIVRGQRVLLKSGLGAFNQEPYNELAATELHRRLMEPGEFVPYWLFEDGRRVYSACANLLGPDEELIPAWDVIRGAKQPNNLSDLQFYVKRCTDVGLDGHVVMTKLAKMFAGDFVVANRDRHYRNFGIIRNVETLKVTRVAPVFDTGSCLWSDAEFLDVPADFLYMAKPFKMGGMRPEEQVKLFEGYFDWLDIEAIADYPETVRAVLGCSPNIPERRIATIVAEVKKRIDVLGHIAR